jgi:RimJ/RimL family protein N-acetyltransferase
LPPAATPRSRAGHPASQAVAERAGFTREGVLRSYMVGKGERLDMVMFSLLPTD